MQIKTVFVRSNNEKDFLEELLKDFRSINGNSKYGKINVSVVAGQYHKSEVSTMRIKKKLKNTNGKTI